MKSKDKGRPQEYEICKPTQISIHTQLVWDGLNEEKKVTGKSKSAIINEALTKRYEKTNKKTTA